MWGGCVGFAENRSRASLGSEAGLFVAANGSARAMCHISHPWTGMLLAELGTPASFLSEGGTQRAAGGLATGMLHIHHIGPRVGLAVERLFAPFSCEIGVLAASSFHAPMPGESQLPPFQGSPFHAVQGFNTRTVTAESVAMLVELGAIEET